MPTDEPLPPRMTVEEFERLRREPWSPETERRLRAEIARANASAAEMRELVRLALIEAKKVGRA